MIEVFKTDVADITQAGLLLEAIHARFSHYRANFDLQDCDRVLRIVSHLDHKPAEAFIQWLAKLGCQAEPLSDIPPTII